MDYIRRKVYDFSLMVMPIELNSQARAPRRL